MEFFEAPAFTRHLHAYLDEIWLFTLYGKDEAGDLTPDQKAQLRAAIDAERTTRRTVRPRRRRK